MRIMSGEARGELKNKYSIWQRRGLKYMQRQLPISRAEGKMSEKLPRFPFSLQRTLSRQDRSQCSIKGQGPDGTSQFFIFPELDLVADGIRTGPTLG
jgi:hypothetical protein